MGDTKYNVLKDIFEVENIFSKIQDIDLFNRLLSTLSKESYCLERELGLPHTKTVQLIRNLWPDKPNTNIKVCTYLLHKYCFKYCANCELVKDEDDFSLNKSRSTGYNTHCKECYKDTTRSYQREYQKNRKLLKINRVPSWADRDKIKEIYHNCPKGYHVDHIIPLQGKLVSGLHIETNLQYLLAEDNIKKRNNFEV